MITRAPSLDFFRAAHSSHESDAETAALNSEPLSHILRTRLLQASAACNRATRNMGCAAPVGPIAALPQSPLITRRNTGILTNVTSPRLRGASNVALSMAITLALGCDGRAARMTDTETASRANDGADGDTPPASTIAPGATPAVVCAPEYIDAQEKLDALEGCEVITTGLTIAFDGADLRPLHALRIAEEGITVGVGAGEIPSLEGLESLERALEVYGTPLYVYHEIVHNRPVVERFRKQGVVFVDRVEDIPPGSTVLYSAHGVAPAIRSAAAQRRRRRT